MPATSSAAILGLTLLGSHLTDAYNGDIWRYLFLRGLLCDDPWILEATEFNLSQGCLSERSDKSRDKPETIRATAQARSKLNHARCKMRTPSFS